MHIASCVVLLLASCHVIVDAASPAHWRSRSIYQVFTDRFARSDNSLIAECNTDGGEYCGGDWDGIIGRLDYIQGMGFDAIWISPVTKNIEGPTAYGEAYHGYWQQDIYALNDHFGTSEGLKRLSRAVHSRNMVSWIGTGFHCLHEFLHAVSVSHGRHRGQPQRLGWLAGLNRLFGVQAI